MPPSPCPAPSGPGPEAGRRGSVRAATLVTADDPLCANGQQLGPASGPTLPYKRISRGRRRWRLSGGQARPPTRPRPAVGSIAVDNRAEIRARSHHPGGQASLPPRGGRRARRRVHRLVRATGDRTRHPTALLTRPVSVTPTRHAARRATRTPLAGLATVSDRALSRPAARAVALTQRWETTRWSTPGSVTPGWRISRLALGCMSYGDPTTERAHRWALADDDAQPFFRQAIELGITFWDTANTYQACTSEEVVGRAIRRYSRREGIVLATKVFGKMHDGPGGSGLSRKAIMEQIDASLTRLGTRLRRPVSDPPFRPWHPGRRDDGGSARTSSKAGKVRDPGASSMYAWQFAKLQHADRRLHLVHLRRAPTGTPTPSARPCTTPGGCFGLSPRYLRSA